MKKFLFTLCVTTAIAACAPAGTADSAAPSSAPAAGASAPAAAASTPQSAAAPVTAAPATPAPAAAAPNGAAVAAPAADGAERKSEYREITIPAGTALPLTLRTTVASDTSNIEDQVRGTLRRAITVDGVQALPEGTAVIGHVTDADRSAKVKGRARIAFRFTRVDLPGDGGQMNIRTDSVARVAAGTKKQDTAKIGGGALGGAIIGGIIGGGDGAAKGAAIGGAGGAGVVLATRGNEVRLAAGTPISVKLTAPLTVRIK